ncbi:unnamed protein product [Sphagnum balticum]
MPKRDAMCKCNSRLQGGDIRKHATRHTLHLSSPGVSWNKSSHYRGPGFNQIEVRIQKAPSHLLLFGTSDSPRRRHQLLLLLRQHRKHVGSHVRPTNACEEREREKAGPDRDSKATASGSGPSTCLRSLGVVVVVASATGGDGSLRLAGATTARARAQEQQKQ